MKLLHQQLLLIGTFLFLSLIPIFSGCQEPYSAIGAIVDFFRLEVSVMEFQQSYSGWLMLVFYVLTLLLILSILVTPRSRTVIASPVMYAASTFLSLYILNLIIVFIDSEYFKPLSGFFLLVLYNGALWLYPSKAQRMFTVKSIDVDTAGEPSSDDNVGMDSYQVVDGDQPLGNMSTAGVRAYLIAHPTSRLKVRRAGVNDWTAARDVAEIMEGMKTHEHKELIDTVPSPTETSPEVPVFPLDLPETSYSLDSSSETERPDFWSLLRTKSWMWLVLCGLLVVLVVIALLVFGTASPTTSTDSVQAPPVADSVQSCTPVHITMKTRTEQSPYATWDLRWPEISIPTNPAMEEYLNRKFTAMANDPDYLGEWVSLSEPDTWSEDAIPAEVSVDYSIEHNSQNILSVVFKRFALWHDAQYPRTDYITITMDLENGRQIGLDYLFNPESGWKGKLATLVREQLEEVLKDELGDSESIMDFRGDDNVLVNANSTPFTIKTDYMVLYYGEDVLVANTPVSHARIAVPLYRMRPYFNMSSPMGRILTTP